MKAKQATAGLDKVEQKAAGPDNVKQEPVGPDKVERAGCAGPSRTRLITGDGRPGQS